MNTNTRPPPLPPESFRRYDEAPDEVFYQHPRFVTHIDPPAIETVTQLYREYLPANGIILDVMSSWISHLPAENEYTRVVGLGMNKEELERNAQLDDYVIQDLNGNPVLPFEDNTFSGAAICVSIDYLTRPVDVLRDLGRVMTSGAPLVITFSNRCFPTKVIAVWQKLDDRGHVDLVTRFLLEAGLWTEIQKLDRSPVPGVSNPLYAVVSRCT